MTMNVLKLVLSCALMLAAAPAALALGPNMMTNSGFEGGDQQYVLQSAFRIVLNPASAHTGAWGMEADLNRTYQNAYQIFSCWTDTDYTTTIWYKGAGSVTLKVMGDDWRTTLRSVPLTATSSWQQASLVWNAGKFTSTMVMLNDDIGPGKIYLDDVFTGLTNGRAISFNAAKPTDSNPKFQLVFDDEFDSAKTIDANNTGASGYHWYTQSFFDSRYDASPKMFAVSGGVLTLMDSGNPWGEVLDTAHPAGNGRGYMGTVFSGGRGLYAEARIAVVNIGSIGKNGWPGWWSGDMKGEVKRNDEMPGNPGKIESVENDFMEYNPTWGEPRDWNSTLHDWGSDGQNLTNANSLIAPPAGTDYTQYHTYGMLWVPARADNGWNGYRQAYFDGIPEQAVCWVGNQKYSAGIFPPTGMSMGSYLFSLMDQDQFQLILGSAQGGTPTMKVDYVRVYAVDRSSMSVIPAGN